jgi:RimJ/RimL family protein N-acetyltransferase
MEIDLGICKIRSLRHSDSSSIAKYANNRNIWINLRDIFPCPYILSDAEGWLESIIGNDPETVFGIEVEGEIAGCIGFHPSGDVNRIEAEVGYWLGEPFWGKGIATTALKAITDYAFANFDLFRLYANVFEWNGTSARVLEKAGYTLDARLRKSVIKNGQVIDSLLYSKIKD